MLLRHFIPVWSGDYRLEAHDESSCTLTVDNPTLAEMEQLGKFLVKARKKKWCSSAEGVARKGESVIKLDTDIVKAGRLLLGKRGRASEMDGRLTVVRSVEGSVQSEHDPEGADKALSAENAEEAVTVRRPTLCCPYPVEGPDVRASEVLQAFCTPAQWKEWEADGMLHCRGGRSGHKYRIAHRHSLQARRQGKIAWDETDGIVMHCYDWSVPPQEEVLAVKLTLENREAWIRNRSGVLGLAQNVYENPFRMPGYDQSMDGVTDTAIVTALGFVAKALIEPLI